MGIETRLSTTSGYILLVREDEQQSLFHLSIQYNPVKLLSCFVNSGAIVGVDDEDEALCSYID